MQPSLANFTDTNMDAQMNDSISPNPNRLIVARHSPDLTQALWRLVDDEKRNDVLAPVTVVTPTRYTGLALRQDLGHAPFVNVRFMVMPMLAELLGGAVLERQGRKPLTSAVESLLLRRVLAQSTGPLARVAEHTSTQSSVREALRQLRDAADGVRTALASSPGITGDIVRMYDQFRQFTGGEWYDAEDLAEAAAEAIISGGAPVLEDLGLIVFYLPRRVSPAAARLMEALAQQHRCVVLIGTTGDAVADAPTAEFAARLRVSLGASEQPDGGTANQPVLPSDAQLHIAPTAHDELRWVIRQVVREIDENRTPLHCMAILYRLADPYAAIIRDELRMAGIPMAGPDPEPLSNSGVGRTLCGLLALSEGEFLRSDVIAWLSACPVRTVGTGTRSINASQWDSISRKAGIVGGLDQWRDRLNGHAKLLSDDADHREAAEEISVARARGMRAEAVAARSLLQFIEKLAADLRPPVDGSPWKEFAKWCNGLLDEYLDADLAVTGSAALDRVRRALNEFDNADSVASEANAGTFRQMINDLLQAPFGHLGPTGRGVFVSSFAAAAGMSFDAVWLVGMIEGAVPPAARPDPLLTEAEWLDSGGHDRMRARMAEERYEYLSAVAGSARRTLSYPVVNPASQRQAYPSRWFLEQASALEDRPVHTGDLPTLADRSWLTINASAEDAIGNAEVAALADVHDYRLKRLLQWRQAGGSLRDHPFAGQPALAGALRLGQNRAQRRLTEFDGNLSSVAGSDRFSVGLRHAPISPSGLEAWATCPYRYFLGYVLGLRSLAAPEDTTSISALDRGLLMHGIMEDFIKETAARGVMPSPGEPWRSNDQERLMKIAENAFLAGEAAGLTGKRLLWEMDKARIRADLERFLEEDAKLRAAHRTGQVMVETRFGSGGDTVDVMDPTSQIRFRGIIDRVDVSADGTAALVIDYKTGSVSPYEVLDNDVIDQGRRLQLGVYSLAAQELFPDVDRVAAVYWFTTIDGGFAFAPGKHFDITDEATARRFHEGVANIVAGINAGLFPANPGSPTQSGPANCRFCDFKSLCPSRRGDLWDRKKSDEAVSAYLRLSEEDGGTDQ